MSDHRSRHHPSGDAALTLPDPSGLRLAAVYADCWEPAVRIAEKVVGDHDIACDIVQEVAASLCERIDSIDHLERMERYFLKGVHQRAFSRVKRRSRRQEILNGAPRQTSHPAVDHVLEQGERNTALRVALARAIRSLPRGQRQVVRLVLLLELDYATAAARLGISYKTLANQLCSARKRLRKELRGVRGDRRIGILRCATD